MNKRQFGKKTIAWSLIAAMLNPAAILPVYGRDSDIYLSVTASTLTAEPNILITLDTSDSMNLPEAWREYAPRPSTAVTDDVNYDSHIEYLWNDCTLINCGATERTTATTATITTAAATVLTPAGSWAGATIADRQALWTAAKASAQTTLAGDPGPRNIWRDYVGAYWFYWLPAGTPMTDLRLSGLTFNRWVGGINVLNGMRGGITYSGGTDFRGNNRCGDSGTDPAVNLGTSFGTGLSSKVDPGRTDVPQGLTPSTVYAPSGAPRNSGRYLNTTWMRWERFLDLRNGKLTPGDTTYPTAAGVGTTTLPAAGIYLIGGGSGMPNVGFPIRGRAEAIVPIQNSAALPLAEWGLGTGSTGAVRDTWPNVLNFGSTTTIGDRGQPIRTRIDTSTVNTVQSGDSRSGWTLPKADMGGFNLADNTFFQFNSAAGVVQLQTILGWYGIVAPASTVNNQTLSYAWKGNRDASPSFDITTGTPAYYDSPVTRGTTSVGSTTVTLPSGANGITAGLTVNIPGAGPGGIPLVTNVVSVAAAGTSLTIGTAASVAVAGTPITRNLRLTTASTGRALRCTVSYTLDADPVAAGDQPAFTALAPQKDAFSTNRWYLKSGAVCRASAGIGIDCSGTPAAGSTKAPALPGGNNYFTQAFGGCAWSGRSSLIVEGVGTYFYGGTCGAAASCTGPNGVAGAAPCPASSFATHTFGSSSYQTRSFCGTSGITDTTIGSTQLAGAKLNDSTGGCGNRGNVAQTCQAREGFASCQYVNTNANATLCPNDTFFTGVITTNNEHTTFVQVANDNTLVHDCTADDGTAYNPSSGYLNGRTDRLFNSAYNLTVSAASDDGAAYKPSSSGPPASGPAIDTYSTNYLNWKFGPKGPSGNPIGRKTRLQIAKDALTSLVATTNGVRFGLMVFNRTAGCTSTNTGTIDVVASSTTLTLSDNPGFTVGQPIKIFGAGAGGTDLITTITAITPDVSDPSISNLTIAPAASTSVASAQVTANPCSGSVSNDGANVAQRILRMGSSATDLPDFNNRATLTTAINAVTANSRTPLTETLYEAYRYFSGRVPRFGVATTAALAGGAVTQGRDAAAVCTATGPGCAAIGVYRSPMLNNPNTTTPAGCQKNFVVLITDGGPEDDWAANSDIKRLSQSSVLGTVSPRTTADATNTDTTSDQFETSGTPYGPTDLSGPTFDGGYIWLDELAYFMGHADVSPGATSLPGDTGPDRLIGRQSVVTYTIGFAGGDSPVLQNASAHAGGGYYLAEDSTALAAALLAAIAAIRDWDPTAAAATVPISVLNRAENATDVYLAFFQPDPSSAWLGTVKKYNLSSDPTDCGGADKVPCLIGQTTLTKSPPNPSPAKNIETVTDEPITGTQSVAVDTNASSLWAPPSVADGGRPNQGGTGYQLINTAGYDPSTRNVYTFISGTSSTVDLTVASNAVKEANTNINKCRLGDAVACITPATPSMTDAARATLINFARGGNPSDGNCSDASPATACTTWRAWPHAAVEHSKPIIVTYDGTPTGSPARATTQYLYFLSNDGLLHAVDTFTGQEKWAFLIEEALPQINALMADTAGQENALADGGLAIYQSDDNGNGIVDGGDKVWLYFGLRRGGRAYYALDITLKDAPQFKWKITANSGSGQLCSGVGACTANADYNELGQSWSAPIVGKIRALGASVPALIFGGGYDPNQDTVPPSVTADTMGRAVYVVNGETGTAVRWFGSGGSVPVAGMIFSIPSDVAALNTDSDSRGFLDRLYVGDMGGNVWRFDIDSATLASWTGKQLADLSGATPPRRKIFFPPAAVKRDVPERFDAVYVGTGDREHPLNTDATPVRSARDAIFMIMDRDVGLTSGPAVAIYPGDFVLVANGCLTACVDPTALALPKKGWARDLETDCTPDAAGIVRCGEKVVSPPTVFGLKLRFGTYSPTALSNACTPPGEGRLNEIDAVTGDLFNLNTADGLTASDRFFSSTGRGYPSASVVIVLGRNVYLVTILDGAPKFQLLGTIGNATKIYWYMEPEQ